MKKEKIPTVFSEPETRIQDLLECPKCKCSWDGGDIYEHFKENYCETMSLIEAEKEALKSAKMYGWSKTDKKHFGKTIIGIELSWDHPNHYDGVSYWQCGECNTTWNRFTNKEEAIPPMNTK